MGEVLIRAITRTEKPKKVRRDGFAPGIIYGEGVESPIPVKFEMNKLKRLLKRHTGNSKVRIKYGEQQLQCIIKEIQRHPVTGEILHIDLQTVNGDNLVKMKISVIFSGRNHLDQHKHLLHVFVSELEVAGSISLIPDFIYVDVSLKKPGDKITVNDIKLNEGLRILNKKDEVLAAVTIAKELEAAS